MKGFYQEFLDSRIKELKERGYYTFRKKTYPMESEDLYNLGYICAINWELCRVELIKTDFILADQIKKHEEKEVTSLEFFNYLYDNLKYIIIFNRKGEVIFGGTKKNDRFFRNDKNNNEVKEKEEIINLINNGCIIESKEPTVIYITCN